jgi:hypothetical protein
MIKVCSFFYFFCKAKIGTSFATATAGCDIRMLHATGALGPASLPACSTAEKQPNKLLMRLSELSFYVQCICIPFPQEARSSRPKDKDKDLVDVAVIRNKNCLY